MSEVLDVTEFEKVCRSMPLSDHILNMVEALKNPVTKIAMFTYGFVAKGVCYGCAATNSICKIRNITIPDKFLGTKGRESFLDANSFLLSYESAIDDLRMSEIDPLADFLSIDLPESAEFYGLLDDLTFISNKFLKTDLKPYTELANYLKSKGL